jgi:hypothetical protein
VGQRDDAYLGWRRNGRSWSDPAHDDGGDDGLVGKKIETIH